MLSNFGRQRPVIDVGVRTECVQLRPRPLCRGGQRPAEGPRYGPIDIRFCLRHKDSQRICRIHPSERDPDDLACRPQNSTFRPVRWHALSSPIRRPALLLCRSGVVLSVGESARIGVESAFIRLEDVLGVQHLGVAQLFGNPEAVDERLGDRPQRAATLVDALRYRLCPFGG